MRREYLAEQRKKHGLTQTQAEKGGEKHEK